MAIVILGGLATSTLLNLFILPALYLRLGRGRGRTQAGRGHGVAGGGRPAGPAAGGPVRPAAPGP